jgi:protein-disulfide isomerase
MSTLHVPVSEKDHIQGDPYADIILVEYGDYECPHCGRAYPIVKQLQEEFGESLCFVYRNFPLREVHPNAESAAETAEFAGSKGKFWEMHDVLYENQDRLGVLLYTELARVLMLDPSELRKSLDTHEFAPRVREDFMGGVRSGVNGTPTFYLNGRRYDAPWDFDDLAAHIQGLLLRGRAAGA